MSETQRVLVWFSAGAASAVAAKLALAEHGHDRVTIAYTDPGNEHPDALRFLRECEQWFGHEVVQLRSDTYADCWEVWEQRRYLVGVAGAPCTVEMKKRPRYKFQRPDDLHVFGYTAEEMHRAERFREQNPGVELLTPLITHGVTKANCLALVERAGIELPVMYRLGYANANCVGCPKGGMGYWNRIRVDFPAVFRRMARLERELDASILRDSKGQRVFLDELDPTRGRMSAEPDIECSLVCVTVEGVIGDEAANGERARQ